MGRTCSIGRGSRPKGNNVLKIAEWRKRRSKTQWDLSALLNIPQSQVSAMERGKRKVTAQELSKIAAYLECKPEDLLGEVAKSPSPESIAELYSKIDRDGRILIFEMMRRMKGDDS